MRDSQPTGSIINDLYQSARAGDDASEKELLRRLTVSFRLVARHRIWNDHDAEEIAQEALLVVATEYKTVALTAGFAAWAYGILSHKIIDHARRKTTRKKMEERLSAESRPESGQGGDPGLRKRLLDCFKRISSSNKRHARILNFKYQGYGTDEICERLKVTPNHLYVLLSRSRAALEKCLEREGKDK